MTLTEPDVAAIAAPIGALVAASDVGEHRPRYNVAPSDRHWVGRGAASGRHLSRARWGIPVRDRLLINARAEPRFVVVTTRASDLIAPLHDRMPALLDPAAAIAWIAAPDLDLLRPAPCDALVATPVSPRAGSVAFDDPLCLEPWQPTPATPRLPGV